MGDKRNFAVLEWVIGEINETLNEARNALEAYVENPKDSTKMRFCLTYIHQVHGSLQMVEFHGASLLAEEMEQLAQAIVNGAVSNAAESHEVMMRSLLQLPAYLEHTKLQKEDHPGVVLPLLNDLRAVRKQSYLSETNLFSPDLSAASKLNGERHPLTSDGKKLSEVLTKLREMYQFSAAGVLRGVKVDENIVYLEKVCTRIEVLTRGTACHPIWEVSCALVDGLRRNEIELSVAVRGLLRYLARDLRILCEKVPASFDLKPTESLLKNLLYYVARADAGSKKVAVITEKYQLKKALFGGANRKEDEGGTLAIPDPEAIRSVIFALQDELNTVKNALDSSLSGQGSTEEIKETLPVVKRIADTLAVLGIGDLRKQVIGQISALEKICEQENLSESDLIQVASKFVDVEHKLGAIAKVVGKSVDLDSVNEREIEIDEAKRTVLKECKHGLEKTKEAIVEYISSKWDPVHLESIDSLLTNIRGGLGMVPLPRPASILGSCNQFIQENLMVPGAQPNFKTLDTLADAIASVEYFIERISDDLEEDADSLLDIAEESVAQLGYRVKDKPSPLKSVPPQEDSSFETNLDQVETGQPLLPTEPQDINYSSVAPGDDQFSQYETAASASPTNQEVSENTETLDNRRSVESPAFYDEESTKESAEEAHSKENDIAEPIVSKFEEPKLQSDLNDKKTEVEQVKAQSTQKSVSSSLVESAVSLDQISVVADSLEDQDDDESDIDDEIIEIFIEESEEVSETLQEYFPKWKDDPKDNDSLVVIRRAFHTLKGSGRMVEAKDIGELAWSVENMLNRIIDKTVNYQPAHGHFIIHVLNLLPTLIRAFEKKKRNPLRDLTEQYRLWGHDLGEGIIPPQLIAEPKLGEQPEIPLQLQKATDAKEQTRSDADLLAQSGLPENEIKFGNLEVASVEEVNSRSADNSAEVDDDEDLVLWEIFSSEAQTHLMTITDFIRDMEHDSPIYSPPSDELQRALHTLKGSAKMAHVTPIAQMAEPLEKFAKELISYQVPINFDILQLIEDLVAYTTDALDSINNDRPVEILKLDQFLARTAELRDLAVGHLIRLKDSQKDGTNQVDPRLLSIFMSEEMKLLLDADKLLNAWCEYGQKSEIKNLISELNTLEMGARQAKLPDMANLSNQLSQAHELALDGQLKCDEDFFEVLSDCHNVLLDMVDAVAAGQNVVPPNEMVSAALDSLISSRESVVGEQIYVADSPESHGIEPSVFEETAYLASNDTGIDEDDEVEEIVLNDITVEEVLDNEAQEQDEVFDDAVSVREAESLEPAESALKNELDQPEDVVLGQVVQDQDLAGHTAESISSSQEYQENESEQQFDISETEIVDLSEAFASDDAEHFEVIPSDESSHFEITEQVETETAHADSSDSFMLVEEEEQSDEFLSNELSEYTDISKEEENAELRVLGESSKVEQIENFEEKVPSELDAGTAQSEFQNLKPAQNLPDDMHVSEESSNLTGGNKPEELLGFYESLTMEDLGQTEELSQVAEIDSEELTIKSDQDIVENDDFVLEDDDVTVEPNFENNNLNNDGIETYLADESESPQDMEAFEIEDIGIGNETGIELESDSFLENDISDPNLSNEKSSRLDLIDMEELANQAEDADPEEEIDLSQMTTSQNSPEISYVESHPNEIVEKNQEESTAAEIPDLEDKNAVSTDGIPGLLDSIDVNDEDYDEDILDVFLEEAEELIEELDDAVHSWELDWSNVESIDQITRALHTLKGGARLAGLPNLGELTHEYESYLIGSDIASVDQTFFAKLHGYQDKVLRGVRAVQKFMSDGVETAAATEPVEISDEAPAPEMEQQDSAMGDVKAQDSESASSASSNILPFAPKQKEPLHIQRDDDNDHDGGRFVMPLQKVGSGGGTAQVALKKSGPQEVIKVSADLLEELVNLAGETSISRGRMEQQITDFGGALGEIDVTIARLQEQLRRLDIETEAQILFRQEQIAENEKDFDPLEMDRYSHLQQLSRSLIESASDLVDLRTTLVDKVRDTETLLLQQSRINSNLQEGLMRSRMVPFSRMVPRLRRIVRQVASEVGKKVSFELDNIEGELDRSVLERMVAPLEHMLRNAVDHGIESPSERVAAGKSDTGRIVLTLGREGGDVTIRLADDGKGIDLRRVREKAIERGLMSAEAELSDRDVMQFILHAGFSTAETVTQISGRGVGMDVVSAEIKQLGGSVSINSTWGQGTEFFVRLPFTVSVNRALMVGIGNDFYAVPLNTIEGIVRVSPFELEHYYSDPDARFEYAGERFQVRYLGNMLYSDLLPKLEGQSLPLPVILVRSAEHNMALQVDALLGSREIVVKSLGQQFSLVQGLSGATVMGDGSVVVILDPHALVRKEMALAINQLPLMISEPTSSSTRNDEAIITVMVVDDSVTVRKVTTRFLEREGFEVITAKDGVDALQVLQDQIPDLMLLDIEMPRMDGFEVAKNIRTSQRWNAIPIIMITSRTGDKHREHALSLGVNRYLGKPYQEDTLLESIRELLAESTKAR